MSDTPRTASQINAIYTRFELSGSGEDWYFRFKAVEDFACQLERENNQLREQLKHQFDLDWTASLCDRVNELLREHPVAREVKDGEGCAMAVSVIHGHLGTVTNQLNQLRAELELARKCVEALRVAKSILELDFDYRPDDNVSWEQCKEAIAAYDQFKASK